MFTDHRGGGVSALVKSLSTFQGDFCQKFYQFHQVDLYVCSCMTPSLCVPVCPAPYSANNTRKNDSIRRIRDVISALPIKADLVPGRIQYSATFTCIHAI